MINEQWAFEFVKFPHKNFAIIAKSQTDFQVETRTHRKPLWKHNLICVLEPPIIIKYKMNLKSYKGWTVTN